MAGGEGQEGKQFFLFGHVCLEGLISPFALIHPQNNTCAGFAVFSHFPRKLRLGLLSLSTWWFVTRRSNRRRAPVECEGYDAAVDDLLLLRVVDRLLRQEALPHPTNSDMKHRTGRSTKKQLVSEAGATLEPQSTCRIQPRGGFKAKTHCSGNRLAQGKAQQWEWWW